MLKACPICYASYEDDESAWGQSEFQRHLLYDHNFGPTTEQPQVDDPLTDYVSEKISSFLSRKREKKEKELEEYEKDYLKRQNGKSDDSKRSKLQSANESILPKVKTRGRPKKVVRTAIPQNSQVRPSGFCIQCKAKLKPTAKFCGICGSKV
jgi:hypothetical protein